MRSLALLSILSYCGSSGSSRDFAVFMYKPCFFAACWPACFMDAAVAVAHVEERRGTGLWQRASRPISNDCSNSVHEL